MITIKKIKYNGQKLEDIFVPISEVKENARQVREGKSDKGFDGLDEYLRKYHKMNNFVMTEHERVGDAFRLRIRRIGALERIRDFIKGN